ncbi:MAG: glycosyltransferase family 2 protein [Balneolaceae bacterium]
MNPQEIIFFTLFILTAPFLGYQFLLGLLALKAKKISSFETDKSRKFAIIVPAHNEEKDISKTIYSLSGLIYPKRYYEVFVIADNCTDNTANISRSLGVTVLERTNKEKTGKGYALRWAFDKILAKQDAFDAIIVVDADSLISGNYLEVMNYYLEQGSRVIQSSDLVLPDPGNWSIEATRIGFLLYNYVKPLGRKVLNLNMGLRGNGMCFSADVLRDVPWEAWSLIEDVEYGLILLLNEEKIDFSPEATVLAQMPVEAKNAESQRSRWELGRFGIIKTYTLKFLAKAIRKRSVSYFDVFLDLITPPFVNIMLMTTALLLLATLLWFLGVLPALHILLWGILLVTGIAYLFLGLYVSGADKNLYKSLLRIPYYIFWKMNLYLNVFRKGKTKEWVRTERDS